MFYRIRGLAIAGLFLFIMGSLFAQTPRELRFGTPISGTLREGEEQWFSVRPTGAGIVTVETFGDTDTYLEAYDASYDFINEDDDGGEGYNAMLEIFVEAGKTYFFKLSCYDEDERNPYRLLASFESIPADTERNTERSRAVPLKLGEAVTVYFRSPDESRWYRYDISRANTLLIVQTRGNMDTIMSLYDARGNLIDEDDDSGEGYNALISARIDSGTVYIKISEYDGQMGRCTFHAEIR